MNPRGHKNRSFGNLMSAAWIAQRKARYPMKARIEAAAEEYRKRWEQDMEAKKKQQEGGGVKQEREDEIEELRKKLREKRRLKNAKRKAARRAQKEAVESGPALQGNSSKFSIPLSAAPPSNQEPHLTEVRPQSHVHPDRMHLLQPVSLTPESWLGPSPSTLPSETRAVTDTVTESAGIDIRNPNKITLPYPRIQRPAIPASLTKPSKPSSPSLASKAQAEALSTAPGHTGPSKFINILVGIDTDSEKRSLPLAAQSVDHELRGPVVPQMNHRRGPPSSSIQRESLQSICPIRSTNLSPSAFSCQSDHRICIHVHVSVDGALHPVPPFSVQPARNEEYLHSCHPERPYRDRSTDRPFPWQETRRSRFSRSRSPGGRTSQPLSDRREIESLQQYITHGSPASISQSTHRAVASDLHPPSLGNNREVSQPLSQARRRVLPIVTPVRLLQPTCHTLASYHRPLSFDEGRRPSKPLSEPRRQSVSYDATPTRTLQPTVRTLASDISIAALSVRPNGKPLSVPQAQHPVPTATPAPHQPALSLWRSPTNFTPMSEVNYYDDDSHCSSTGRRPAIPAAPYYPRWPSIPEFRQTQFR